MNIKEILMEGAEKYFTEISFDKCCVKLKSEN
jgi:hypothetical protein